MKIAVYTAIFGPYDGLLPQPKLKGVDYICFTDQDFKSKTWQIVKKEPPIQGDSTRSARFHKINPHLFLADYDVSIWMDGNMLIIGDIHQLIQERLNEQIPMLVFDHNQSDDARNTVKEEYENLVNMVNEGTKNVSLEKMQQQVERYAEEGFQDDQGLVFSAVLLRLHNNEQVKKAMQAWWQEVKNFSNRDQLSFNFSAWKTQLPFAYLEGDLRDGNAWFHMIGRHRTSYKGKWFRYRLKKLFGLK